jgi:hypothetical protein
MATAAERKALNEGTFREANEQLERGARELVGVDEPDPIPFICECPRRECTQIVLLTLSEYERVRSGSRSGLAALGHEDPTIERVIEQNDRFIVTEKFGEAGAVHSETYPRG